MGMKVGMSLLRELEKSSLKLIWKEKRGEIGKGIVRKKKKGGGMRVGELKV